MTIAFHGAARTVTGSKHLITLADGRKILFDCGLFQGMGGDTASLNSDFGFAPAEVDAMVLSHAHIDHTGLIPKLVKDGFTGAVFCTDATAELAALLLTDSAEIQESEARYRAKKTPGSPYAQPLYTATDAAAAVTRFRPQPYSNWFTVMDGVEGMFTDAGHIIGSACVHLRITENGRQKTLTFSGDVGRYSDAILRSPAPFPQADIIIMESTYGNTLHQDVSASVETILQWIENICVRKKGKLILPAFSLGRTQEILYALNLLSLQGRLPAVNYFLDSPLSTSITEVVQHYPHYFNEAIQKMLLTDDNPFEFTGLQYIKTVEESKSLNFRNGPCVIISASGMAEAGRVKHHISNNIENSKNGVLMTGYCEPRSLGGRLLSGAKEVSIFGVHHEVNAAVGGLKSMSAHADYKDLEQWLSGQDAGKVKQLFLVHGEYPVQQDLQARLQQKGFGSVVIPELHSTWEADI